MIEIASLVLFTADFEASAGFYRAVGLELADEDHGEGLPHLAADLGAVHFAIYPADPADPDAEGPAAPGWREPGSSFPGFYVDSLDDTVARLTEAGAPILVRHQVRPWACRVIVEDPDGRPIEINQLNHCPTQ